MGWPKNQKGGFVTHCFILQRKGALYYRTCILSHRHTYRRSTFKNAYLHFFKSRISSHNSRTARPIWPIFLHNTPDRIVAYFVKKMGQIGRAVLELFEEIRVFECRPTICFNRPLLKICRRATEQLRTQCGRHGYETVKFGVYIWSPSPNLFLLLVLCRFWLRARRNQNHLYKSL